MRVCVPYASGVSLCKWFCVLQWCQKSELCFVMPISVCGDLFTRIKRAPLFWTEFSLIVTQNCFLVKNTPQAVLYWPWVHQSDRCIWQTSCNFGFLDQEENLQWCDDPLLSPFTHKCFRKTNKRPSLDFLLLVEEPCSRSWGSMAVFSCWLLWGQLNKDSISLLPDRQLRKYLQPYCNAAKWILEGGHECEPERSRLRRLCAVLLDNTHSLHIPHVLVTSN